MPVIHNGYIEFLERNKDADTIFLLTSEFVSQLDERIGGQLQRDIRAIPVDCVVEFIHRFFARFFTKTLDSFDELKDFETIVLLDEDVSDMLKTHINKTIVTDQAFLRWDWKSVNIAKEVVGKFSITEELQHRTNIAYAVKISSKSSDVWRQVGAVVVLEKRILYACNEHKPNQYIPYIYGDQRLSMTPGEKPDVCGALHAEKSIIAQAAKEGIPLLGESIYVTTFPCSDCARVIVESGITKVFFKEGYSNMDAAEILLKAGIEIFQVK